MKQYNLNGIIFEPDEDWEWSWKHHERIVCLTEYELKTLGATPIEEKEKQYCCNCMVKSGYVNVPEEECACSCHLPKINPCKPKKIEKLNICEPGTHVDLSYPARHEDLLVTGKKLNEVIDALNERGDFINSYTGKGTI